jgi:glucokinase
MVQDVIAGIDIGGTKIAVSIAAAGGQIIARNSFPTDADGAPHEVMNQALAAIESLANAHHVRLRAVGVGCAGPLDFERGIVLTPPNMPRSWRQFPLRSVVESRLGLPVILDNDANAAALGEYFYGAGRGYTDLVYMTISTGIGVGIIASNNLVHRGGEGGHITVQPGGALCGCGARGCMEGLCSGTGIALRAQEHLRSGAPSKLREMVTDIEQVTAKIVEHAAREGDDLASAVWRETIDLLAIGIGSIIALLAPQAVVLGGGVAVGAGEFLLQPLREELNERVRIVPMDEVRVLQARLEGDSGIYGALVLGARALQPVRT